MPVSKKRKPKKAKKTTGGRISEKNRITEHQKAALEWAVLRNPTLFCKILSGQGQDEIGGAQIKEEAASQLIRSKEYYAISKNKPFIQAYLVPHFPNMEMLPNNLRYMTVEEVFKSLHASIQRAFPYHELPDFDLLFFGPGDEVLKRIRVAFESVSEQIGGEEITARARHIIDEIDRIGGLCNAKRQDNDYRGPTIFGTIRELNATDKAYVYFYNYVQYHQLDRLLAFNAGFAHFMRGDYDRALFFYFMTGLFPFAGDYHGITTANK